MCLSFFSQTLHPHFQKQYGKWSNKIGLNVVAEQKWRRRQNLEGVNFKIVTLQIFPYVNKMTAIPGKLNEFETEEGMYVEILHGLQVLSFDM